MKSDRILEEFWRMGLLWRDLWEMLRKLEDPSVCQ
jgi:hypothetical protein